MQFTTYVLVTAVIIGLVWVLYKRAEPRELTASKPLFCLLPKYRFKVTLPDRILGATDQMKALTAALEPMGFNLARQNEDSVVFTRGSILGDFSIKLVKLNLSIEWPLNPESTVVVGFGGVAAFDTGDLWTFSMELKERLERRGQVLEAVG